MEQRKEEEVIIDFDEASREWRKNKIKCKNCYFKYTCNHLSKKGKRCPNEVFDVQDGLCRWHCNNELSNKNIINFFTMAMLD